MSWQQIEENFKKQEQEAGDNEEALLKLRVEIGQAKAKYISETLDKIESQKNFFEKAIREIGEGKVEPNHYAIYEHLKFKPSDEVKNMLSEELGLYEGGISYRKALGGAREARIHKIREKEAIEKVEEERELHERKMKIIDTPNEAESFTEKLRE